MKNLDDLFREKLKTFREVPDEKVWTAIENSLNKKPKKRVIPLWWQLGGVAAVLAIAFFTFYTVSDSGDGTPTVTDTENTKFKDTEQDGVATDSKKDEKDAFQIPEVTDDALVNSPEASGQNNTERFPDLEDDGVSGSEKSSGMQKSKNQKDALPIPGVNADAVADGMEENTNQITDKYSDSKSATDSFQNKLPNTKVAESDDVTFPKDKDTKNFGNTAPEKTQLATNDPNSSRGNADSARTDSDAYTIQKNDKAIAIGEENKAAVAIADGSTSEKSDTSKTPDPKEKLQDGMVAGQGNLKNTFENSDKAIVQNNPTEKEKTTSDDNKISVFDAIEAQAEEEKVTEAPSSRWSAGPNVAPVYFNAIGEGSPIDPGFSPNSKSGSTNMSYGVSIAYTVTKKLSVRSGIHKAEYGYNTNNVGFSPTLAASTSGRLQNVDYTGGPGNLEASSPNLNLDASENLAPEFSTLNSARDGTIAQSFGYLEVPLELDYALIDRRFGVNLVGGISSLFLIDNSVILNSGELTTEIGEARNLNDLNFSTNIGFGVNYKFTPKVQLNIEPVFKYQLNTFSNISGDFRPFTIGVYSGLNFRF